MSTPSYRIRPYRVDDGESLYAAARESVAELHPWLPWCHPGYTLEEAVGWIGSRAARAAAGLAYDFAIEGLDHRFIGACGISQINRIHRFGNVGYWVRTSECGRGAAVCAVGLLARLAFRELELVRLEILCAVGNQRSQRVAEKAGAVFEGVLRHRLVLHGSPQDAMMYSIVKVDLQPAGLVQAGGSKDE